MRLTRGDQEATLLSYDLSTSPLPLHAHAQNAAITVVVTNAGAVPIRVKEIILVVRIGDPQAPDAVDLTEVDAFRAEAQNKGWTLSPLGSGRFAARPDTPEVGTITTQGLALVISGIHVSTYVGTTPLDVEETATDSDAAPQTRYGTLLISKFPEGFFAGDLQPSRLRVHNHETVDLTWSGSPGAGYKIYWEDSSEDVTQVRRWRSPPLTETTLFTLVVKVEAHGQTIEEHFTAWVVVSDPSMVLHDLKVKGPTRLEANLQVAGRIEDQTGAVMPVGGIILWSGAADHVPRGWALCDGDGGRPDLRGRFVVGLDPRGGEYHAPGLTGGATHVQLSQAEMPAHTHDGQTGGGGRHHHRIEGTDADGLSRRRRTIWGDTTVDMGYGGGWNSDPNEVHWRGHVNTDDAGDHTHGFQTHPTGGGGPHENRPPYYVLAYIIKL
jgi:hypothetical protein